VDQMLAMQEGSVTGFQPRTANVHLSIQAQEDIHALAQRWGTVLQAGPFAGQPNVSATIARALRETVERES
jgi:hypothetical protein